LIAVDGARGSLNLSDCDKLNMIAQIISVAKVAAYYAKMLLPKPVCAGLDNTVSHKIVQSIPQRV
jgi:hypothetical protein